MNFEIPPEEKIIDVPKTTETNLPMPKEKTWESMEGIIKGLSQVSKFKRISNLDGTETVVSPESEKFNIKHITNLEDPGVQKIFDLCEATFKPEENDTIDILQDAVTLKHGAYHTIENDKSEVVSYSNCWSLDLQPFKGEELEKPLENILFIAYIVTSKEYRGKQVAPELYQNMYQFGLEKAKVKEQGLKAIVGEAVEKVEPFLNKMGRKRMYYEDQNGDIREVPYLQGPTDWNLETGEPQSDTAKEHLMIKMTDGRQSMSADELMPMILAIYQENYIIERRFFENDEAYEKCRAYNMQLLDDLASKLSQAKEGKILFLSAEEREVKKQELESKGKQVYEIGKDGYEEITEGE